MMKDLLLWRRWEEMMLLCFSLVTSMGSVFKSEPGVSFTLCIVSCLLKKRREPFDL